MKLQLIMATTRHDGTEFPSGAMAGLSIRGTYSAMEDAVRASISLAGSLAGANQIKFTTRPSILDGLLEEGELVWLASFDSKQYRYDIYVYVVA